MSDARLPDNPLDDFELRNGELRPSRNPEIRVEQRAFLVAFAAVGRPYATCKIIGISPRRYDEWMIGDELFREAMEHAKDERLAKLEEELYRRAVIGVLRKKFFKGDPLIDPETGKQYVEREFSDRLLELALKAEDPVKYRDKEVKHSGQVIHDHQHAGTIRVIEDGDWYGNAHRLPATDAAAPTSNSLVTGPIQNPVVRATIREDGLGDGGGTAGPRLAAEDVSRCD